MYCQNCGAEIDENSEVCQYCGSINNITKVIQQKDIRIQEMEHKISELEQIVKKGSNPRNKTIKENFVQPWIFIFPIIFVMVFFIFFIILVSIR
jgi:uncharacterized membrane protein YvbJ